jgi:hypothetical protein
MGDTALAIITGGMAMLLVGISAWVRGRNDEREALRMASSQRDAERHGPVDPGSPSAMDQARPSIPG